MGIKRAVRTARGLLVILGAIAWFAAGASAGTTTCSVTSSVNGADQPVNSGGPVVEIGGGFKWLNTSFTKSVDLGNQKMNSSVSMSSFVNTSSDFLVSDVPQLMTGDWGPVPSPTVVYTFGGYRLGSIGGQIDAYTLGVGTGPAVVAKTNVSFSLSDTLTIVLPEPTTIEIPMSLTGECVVFSFGLPDETFGVAQLSISGSLGPASTGTFEGKADTRTGDLQKLINESRVLQLELDAGVHELPFNISGSGSAESQGKGYGLFGIMAGTSTAVVSFPNTVYVGGFTGPGGAPLPAGTAITGDAGVAYPAVIVPEPATMGLLGLGLGWLLHRRRRGSSSQTQ